MLEALHNSLFWPFLASLGMVFVNEMGDKTQLLAMAFATRIKFWKVMLGIFIATILNHGLAVALGSVLAKVPGWHGWVQLITAVLFIVFGLWALIDDKADDGANKKSRLGDVATVTGGFFMAEMGDKTQLATIGLAAQFPNPFIVLAGTTTGMMFADGLGILIGNILHKKLPDRFLKIMAAVIFVLFGLAALWESLTAEFKAPVQAALGAVLIAAALSAIVAVVILKNKKSK